MNPPCKGKAEFSPVHEGNVVPSVLSRFCSSGPKHYVLNRSEADMVIAIVNEV